MVTELLDNGFVALFILVDVYSCRYKVVCCFVVLFIFVKIRWFVALLLCLFLSRNVYPELFSIELHHGGEISYEVYAGRKVTYMDNCDKDLMSLQVIDDMVEIPNIDLSNGLELIQSDSDVQTMCNFVPKDKVIEM
ncbi:hypothetical protein DVH24_041530 [Malus domestica]|uniref:Uncharacterized protein n=1 Tax=Malus domestica TaxID=3750 RepID=A0A498IGK6_MALDO|nr:hypothetical protein DVH24_041530 [Malus domestica]